VSAVVMKTLRLSPAAADWLVVDSGLSVSPVSPFASLREAPPRSSPAERAAAAEAELFAAGITFGPDGEGDSPAAPFREGLELLARPEARIQIVTQAAGKAPIKMSLYAHAGHAVPLVFDGQIFHVGPRRPLDATFAALQEQVRAPRALEGRQILFWPSVLSVWAMLWPGANPKLEERLTLEEALGRLGAPTVGKDKVEAVLRELEQKDLLFREAGSLSVPSEYRPWLRAALSGDRLQIDYTPLDGDRPSEGDERSARLTFVGPSGGRVLSRTLAGEELTQALRGTPATEERAIRLSALPAEPLANILRLHLGLAKPD
jgi:hypothetical protein